MSYDTSLYFRTLDFPMEEWMRIISERGAMERNIVAASYNKATIKEWKISTNPDNALWTELRDLSFGNLIHPEQTYWEISITINGNRPEDIYFQLKFCYEVLLQLPGILFYDRRHGIFAETEQEFLNFARTYLSQFGISKMFKLGLMDGDGNVLF
jgi:hypothetical protein